VANLVLIAVMVVIFGAALLLPFPGRNRVIPATADAPAAAGTDPAGADGTAGAGVLDSGDAEDRRMWTNRVRRWALSVLPPQKLLPDRQPAYVASWVYVFGVASLAALFVAIVSGFAIAVGGPDWWHTNPVGHFFNSMHLWSVELFFFVMVIHLWGKFFMGAWRGGRGATWVTGAITFLIAIGTAFTGYLSQQNFDAQWIATQGKDGLNAVGIGAFFNPLDFGQMYTFHVLLLPFAVVAIAIWHVLLVRKHGVVPPYPARALAAREPGPGASSDGGET
jgi:ubiquinol-cytochrome c reductase cytochrome b subunit